MAKVNGVATQLSGKVGQLIYRQTKYGTVVYEAPAKASVQQRTEAQMQIRTQWGNMAAVYRQFNQTLKKGFEGLNGKMNDYNAFIQANTNVVKVYVPKSVRLNGGSVLAPYQITRGTLPSVAMVKNSGGVLVSDIGLGSLVHFRETFIVPGNHEFYQGYDIAQTMEDFEFEYRDNVRYLNNRSVMLGDSELFFTTLWTKIDPIHLWTIQRGMNDFRHGKLNGQRLFANDVDDLHRQCLDWLSGALAKSQAAHKVVVTHHCPTLRDAFNGYPGGALNSAFQVDLDVFIEGSGVDYWVYGHTHYAGGSGSKIGETTLLCNQLGYVFQNEHLGFERAAVIDV